MFNFPATTQIDKVFSKEHLPRALRQRVEKIRWINKIQRESINLDESGEVREFEIFRIDLKDDAVSQSDILKIVSALDSKIKPPSLWRVYFNAGGHCCDLAFPRKSGEGVPEHLKDLEKFYIFAEMQALDFPIPPQATSITALWKLTLCNLAKIAYRPNETIKALRERKCQIATLQKKIEQLNKKLSNEKQINRRTEIFKQKQEIEKELQKIV